jgi:ATP-dependent 26S proteasome regulatory subunit
LRKTKNEEKRKMATEFQSWKIGAIELSELVSTLLDQITSILESPPLPIPDPDPNLKQFPLPALNQSQIPTITQYVTTLTQITAQLSKKHRALQRADAWIKQYRVDNKINHTNCIVDDDENYTQNNYCLWCLSSFNPSHLDEYSIWANVVLKSFNTALEMVNSTKIPTQLPKPSLPEPPNQPSPPQLQPQQHQPQQPQQREPPPNNTHPTQRNLVANQNSNPNTQLTQPSRQPRQPQQPQPPQPPQPQKHQNEPLLSVSHEKLHDACHKKEEQFQQQVEQLTRENSIYIRENADLRQQFDQLKTSSVSESNSLRIQLTQKERELAELRNKMGLLSNDYETAKQELAVYEREYGPSKKQRLNLPPGHNYNRNNNNNNNNYNNPQQRNNMTNGPSPNPGINAALNAHTRPNNNNPSHPSAKPPSNPNNPNGDNKDKEQRTHIGPIELNPDGSLPEPLQGLDPVLVEAVLNDMLSTGTGVSFDDVAGLSHCKQAIKESLLWPMLRPDWYTGLRDPPKGLLLFGPPGTGKTMLGKAIAQECNARFFSISASSLTSKWFGQGEKMVRTLFAVCRYLQPCVLFFDEIDSILTSRQEGEQEAGRRIKTELLIQMDGINASVTNNNNNNNNNNPNAPSIGLIVIGATNLPKELDQAAFRRLPKRLYVPLPGFAARQELISRLLLREKHHALSQDDIKIVARRTRGYSAADMTQVCTEAAMVALRELMKDVASKGGGDSYQRSLLETAKVRPLNLNDFLQTVQQTVKPSVNEKIIDEVYEFNESCGSFQIPKWDEEENCDDGDTPMMC